jgi:flagellar export protein FliJ
MKSIVTLLRVKQREMDVLKRQQVVIENQRLDILTRIDRLSDQLLHEMQTAEAMPEMSHFFGDFATTIKKRQEQLRVQLKKLEVELDKIAVQILDRFSEMKKYELALENWKKRRAAEMARREQQAMDEVAIRGYVRRDAQ